MQIREHSNFEAFGINEPINGFRGKLGAYGGYESETERNIARFLTQRKIEYYYDYHLDWVGKTYFQRRYDFYIPPKYVVSYKNYTKGFIIEVDGNAHEEDPTNPGHNIYGNDIEKYLRVDQWKNEDAEAAGILLIRIKDWYKDWEEISECFSWLFMIELLDPEELESKQLHLRGKL